MTNEGIQRVLGGGRQGVIHWPVAICLSLVFAGGAFIAPHTAADDWETPQTRLRPIGSPSAVDAFRRPQPTGNLPAMQPSPPSSRQPVIRQAAMMQSVPEAFSMPPQGNATPAPSPSLPAPLSSLPGLGPVAPPPADFGTTPLPRGGTSATTSPVPQNTIAPSPGQAGLPPGMTPVPRWGAPAGPAASGGDYAPLPQPQLESNFATLGNCRNISPPSGYRSDRILTCGPPAGYVTTVGASGPPPTYLPPPAQLGPPVTLPPAAIPMAASQTVIPGPAGHRPLISFGQERYPVQIGQGILGQPVAYVPGQTFRNAIRYITW